MSAIYCFSHTIISLTIKALQDAANRIILMRLLGDDPAIPLATLSTTSSNAIRQVSVFWADVLDPYIKDLRRTSKVLQKEKYKIQLCRPQVSRL